MILTHQLSRLPEGLHYTDTSTGLQAYMILTYQLSLRPIGPHHMILITRTELSAGLLAYLILTRELSRRPIGLHDIDTSTEPSAYRPT